MLNLDKSPTAKYIVVLMYRDILMRNSSLNFGTEKQITTNITFITPVFDFSLIIFKGLKAKVLNIKEPDSEAKSC